jgi:thiamine transport system permease protein
VAIYRFLSQPGALNYGQAMAMATILMALTVGGILEIESLRLPGGVLGSGEVLRQRTVGE